jgi:hypothetical protein
MIKGFWEFTYIQNKSENLKKAVFMIDVNKLKDINIALFKLLQNIGYIYRKYEDNIILIHDSKLCLVPLNIDYHPSIILKFLIGWVNECNICFSIKNVMSGCFQCDFNMCVDCAQLQHNNNNYKCYQCGKQFEVQKAKVIGEKEKKKFLTKLLKKHKDFNFKEDYQNFT